MGRCFLLAPLLLFKRSYNLGLQTLNNNNYEQDQVLIQNLIELLSLLNEERDGSYFLGEEAKDLIETTRDLLENYHDL